MLTIDKLTMSALILRRLSHRLIGQNVGRCLIPLCRTLTKLQDEDFTLEFLEGARKGLRAVMLF